MHVLLYLVLTELMAIVSLNYTLFDSESIEHLVKLQGKFVLVIISSANTKVFDGADDIKIRDAAHR